MHARAAGILVAALAAASGTVAPVRSEAACKIKQIAELPVTMSGMRPLVHAKINGRDALFVADSGAFYSTLTPAAAAEYNLRLSATPPGFVIHGIGGEARAWLTTVKTLTLFDVPIPNMEFLVAGNDAGRAVGFLGQNVFRIGDVEYDLANGTIRLMRPEDCRKAQLAYWANTQPYSVIDIEWATAAQPHTIGAAYLNGTKIRVGFDTGATLSVLTLEAARRAGVKPGGEGVVPAGTSQGIGQRLVPTWIAPFESFKIGSEEVRNTRLRISDTQILEMDMLIGADFFLSHRIYVASSQHKLYFTYNGGPVFNLTTAVKPAPAAAPANTVTAPADASPPAEPVEEGPQPADAAGFSRRGSAFAARREFGRAIADLDRACELAPGEASYFYQRGLAHLGNRQPDLALADFDQALKLKGDDLPTLVTRAQVGLQRRDNAAAIADLDAADRAAPKESAVRLQLGDLYLHAGQFAQALGQFNLWIGVRSRYDAQMPHALNARCWARALWGQELEQALKDCDAALRLMPDSAEYLDSRGLVHLRRGEYDKAIADYDRGLHLQPRNAWSHYGRGVAKLRKGLTAEGQADLAAATALQADIAEEAKKSGVTP